MFKFVKMDIPSKRKQNTHKQTVNPFISPQERGIIVSVCNKQPGGMVLLNMNFGVDCMILLWSLGVSELTNLYMNKPQKQTLAVLELNTLLIEYHTALFKAYLNGNSNYEYAGAKLLGSADLL